MNLLLFLLVLVLSCCAAIGAVSKPTSAAATASTVHASAASRARGVHVGRELPLRRRRRNCPQLVGRLRHARAVSGLTASSGWRGLRARFLCGVRRFDGDAASRAVRRRHTQGRVDAALRARRDAAGRVPRHVWQGGRRGYEYAKSDNSAHGMERNGRRRNSNGSFLPWTRP